MSKQKQNQKEEMVEVSKAELEELRRLKAQAEEKERKLREMQQKEQAKEGISMLKKSMKKECSWENVLSAALTCPSIGQKEIAEFSENGGLATRVMCARQALAHLYRNGLLHPQFAQSIKYWVDMAD